MDINIKSETVELVLTSLFGGVRTVYEDTYKPWLDNKRINKYGKYTLHRKDGSIEYYENGTPVIWNNLDSIEQLELIKFRNMGKNGEFLNEKLTNVVNDSEDKENISKNIMEGINLNEDALLYYVEKSKFISSDKKSDIIANVISDKLSKKEEIDTNILEFFTNITVSELEKLILLRRLIFTYSAIRIDKDNCINEILVYGSNDDTQKVVELNFGYFFPKIQGDTFLKGLQLGINWDDIINFSLKGLYTESTMNRYLNTNVFSDDSNLLYFFSDCKHRRFLCKFKGEQVGHNFQLSQLGKSVFSHLPVEEPANDNYIVRLNEHNCLPGKLVDVSDVDTFDEIISKYV